MRHLEWGNHGEQSGKWAYGLVMVAFGNMALDMSREDPSSPCSMEKEKGKLRALQMLCRILSFEQDMRLGDLVGKKSLAFRFLSKIKAYGFSSTKHYNKGFLVFNRGIHWLTGAVIGNKGYTWS